MSTFNYQDDKNNQVFIQMWRNGKTKLIALFTALLFQKTCTFWFIAKWVYKIYRIRANLLKQIMSRAFLPSDKQLSVLKPYVIIQENAFKISQVTVQFSRFQVRTFPQHISRCFYPDSVDQKSSGADQMLHFAYCFRMMMRESTFQQRGRFTTKLPTRRSKEH